MTTELQEQPEFYLHQILTENQFNKVRRNQLKTGDTTFFFIHHTWDEVSQTYLRLLKANYGLNDNKVEEDNQTPIYMVDYFKLPAKMSGLFKVKKMPTLVVLQGKPEDDHPNPVQFVDYPGEIDEVLGL